MNDAPRQAGVPAPRGRVHRVAFPGFAVGVALFTILVARQGVREVLAALSVEGWGLLIVALFHLAPMSLDAAGWWIVLPPRERPGIGAALFARWVGESVNGLLPAMQIGGNIAKARVLARHGVDGVLAGASVVVDVTLVMLSQIAFTVVGLLVLLAWVGGRGVAPAAVVGLGLSVTALLGFAGAQRFGIFSTGLRILARVRPAGGSGLAPNAAALDACVTALYAARGRVLGAWLLHLISWVVGVGEVWFALRFLGHPVDLLSATILESLTQAVRGAAFAVPGALGIQEGGLLLLGTTLGIAPDTALALSLTKRVREITLGLPGLVAWQLDWASHRRTGTQGMVEDR